MKKYPAYKDSGIEWVGEFPENWKLKPLKYLVGCNMESLSENTPEDFRVKYIEIGDVSLEKGITNFENYRFDSAPSRARRIVKEGDVIISTVRTYLRAVSSITGKYDNFIVSTGFAVLTPNNIDSTYLNYIIINEGFIGEVISLSKGVSYPSITSNDLLNIKIPIPCFDQQTQIGKYLNQKTQQIEDLIAKKERLIELLEEERTALINQSVTKGLDPNAPMKDSGIDWLGEIPEHWEIIKLKYFANIVLGKMLTNEDKGGYVQKPYLRGKNIEWMKPNIKDIKTMWFSKSELIKYRLIKNDLLVSEGGEVGRTCIWNNEIDECYIQNSVHKVTMSEGYNSEYFLNQFRLYGFKGHFDAIVNRISIAHLTKEKLSDVKFICPPTSEQNEIVKHIKVKLNVIRKASLNHKRRIELLKEYKTTLISEAVSGKIDIREKFLIEQ